MSDTIDWFLRVAAARGVPGGWTWTSSRALEGGFLVGGAVCTATFKSGPRKGRLNWAKRLRDTERELFISRSDLQACKEQWEAETGKCYHCCGSGKVFVGWSSADGTKHGPCPRCKATGKAPEATTP